MNKKTYLVILGLVLGILVAATDNTIVSTAMGSIISDFGEMDMFVWISSAYMITSVSGMLIYGKLADVYGRKKFYMFGTSLFLIGAFLSGSAQNMTQLIICRAIQGIGGGGVVPMAFTIIFDTVPFEKRGKITGLFGATFGLANLIAPLLGAFLTEYINWRWIFLINLPFGVVSLILIQIFYTESGEQSDQKIDWLGAGVLTTSILCLMFALEIGGNDGNWGSFGVISLFAAALVTLIIFLLVQKRSSNPILPYSLFMKNKLFAASQILSFIYGVVFILAVLYIPLFIQLVQNGTATNAGLILLPMTIGSVIGSQIGGRVSVRTPYRNVMIGSYVFALTGLILLSSISSTTSKELISVYMTILGLGVGVSLSTLNMSSIHKVSVLQRGIATSSASFFRTLGMTIGLTVYGTIQKELMNNKLGELLSHSQGFEDFDARALLQPAVRDNIPSDILNILTNVSADSIASIFKFALPVLTLAIIFIIIMGKERLVRLLPFRREKGDV